MIFRQVFESMSLGDLGVLGERMPLAEIAKDAEKERIGPSAFCESIGPLSTQGATLGLEEALWQAADKMRRNLKGLGFDVLSGRNLQQPVREIVQEPLARCSGQKLPQAVAVPGALRHGE